MVLAVAAAATPQWFTSLDRHAAFGGLATVVDAAGPILNLPMNEGTGTTVADTSGNGSNGVLQNGPTWITGKSGTGVKFDGKDDTLYVSSPTALNTVKTGVTVSAWVYRNANQAGDIAVLAREQGATYYEHYYLGFHDGKYQWFVNTSSGYSNLNMGSAAPVSQWVHMVGTFDGSTVRLYVNGVQQYSTPHSGTFATDTTGLTIGASHNAASHVPEEALNGNVDEVQVYNYALSTQEVTQLYQTGSNAAPSGPSGPSGTTPLVKYSLDEGTGTSAADSSGNGYNAVLQNGPTWVTGKSGMALNFDGKDDTLFMSNSTGLNNVKTAVTVMGWVYRNASQSGEIAVLSRQVGTTYYEHYLLGFKDGKYLWFVNTTSGYSDMTLGGAAPTGQWVHVAGTYDGSTVRFYVNGVQQFSSPFSGTFATDTTGLAIGVAHNDASRTPTEAFNGKLDDIAVYSYALSAAEITTAYQAGSTSGSTGGTGGTGGTGSTDGTGGTGGTTTPPATSPILSLPMDEGTGTTTTDASGNGSNGVLQNGPTWTTGKSGSAIKFDGSNDVVYVSSPTALNSVKTAVTVSAWVYRNANQSGDVAVLAREQGTTWYEHYYLGFHDGKYQWFVNTSSGYSAMNLGAAAPTGQWVHMVGTYDGSTVRFYVNGVQQYSTPWTGTFATDTTGLTIGASHNAASHVAEEAFNGNVDEVNVYAYAMSATEVSALYQSKASGSGTVPPTGTGGTGDTGGTGGTTTPAAPSGAILNLSLNEGSGTTAADTSGGGSNGVLQNGPTWTTGVSGTGVKFDGSNDVIYVSSPTALNNVKTAVTVSAWVYRSANQAGDISVISREQGTTWYEDYYLGFRDGKYQWFVNTSSGYSNLNMGTVAAPVGQWVHMVGTYDGSTVRLYVNGVQQYSTPWTGTFATDTTGITIGASHNSGSHVAEEALNGSIDEVSIYSRALTASEVTQLYQATSAGAGTTPPAGGSTAPVAVAFSPSPDHDTLVTYYSLDLHRSADAVTATPVSLVDLGKPSVVSGAIQVDITNAVSVLPAGSYYVVVKAIGSGGTSQGAQSAVFTK